MESIVLPSETEASLLELVRLIAEIRIRNEEREKTTHERFNVFTTLLQANDEVRLHTRFLHCLLNPQGLHDCGPLFLNLFFDILRDEKLCGRDHDGKAVTLDLPSKIYPWSVSKETRELGHGQLDILLDGGTYGIAIENKIHHNEGEIQLARYAEALTGRYRKSWALIYLTLDGQCGVTAANAEYLRISYAEHILKWLERCLCATYSIIPINQVILQYRNVVRHLTNQTLNAEAMKPIVKFIRLNPGIVRFKEDIKQGIDEAIREVWTELERMVSSDLSGDYKVELMDGASLASGYETALILRPDGKCVLTDAPFEIYAVRDYDCDCFYIGIVHDPKSLRLQSDPEFYSRLYVRMVEKAGSTFHQSQPNKQLPAGWHDLLIGSPEEQVAQLLEGGGARVCAEIRIYLKMLTSSYAEVMSSTDVLPSTTLTEILNSP